MAQTIAAQRGSTTVTANGTTNVTLFTQSSGTATRVILNSVSCWTTNGGTSPKMGLMINSNGSGNLMPVAYKGLGTSYTVQALTMFPNESPTSQIAATSNTGGYADAWIMYGTTQGPAGVDLESVGLGGPGGNSSSGFNYFNISNTPSQFWMNSNDSLIFRCSFVRATRETATVYYSFTTITES